MAGSFSRSFTRDDGETEVEITFSFTPGSAPSGLSGPPEHYDPGSGPEIDIEAVRLDPDPDPSAPDVELTEAEIERFETWVAENEDDFLDDGPDEYERDYD